jgi:hypothetical protein
MNALGNQQTLGAVNPWLELVTGLSRTQHRSLAFGIVTNQNDWPLPLTPGVQKALDVGLAGRVIARWHVWVLEAILHIDDD